MKFKHGFRNSALITAGLASLCCLTPVLAVLGGLGGIASAFTFLEPLRPYFVAFTFLILGGAFYKAYKPKKTDEIACDCEKEKQSFFHSKAFLWIITLMAIALISFPYYSQSIFPGQRVGSAINARSIITAQIDIEGMTCASCEHSVDYALESEQGVVMAKSSYKNGLAVVQYDTTKVTPRQLKRAIEHKVGYKVRAIHPIRYREITKEEP